MKLYIANAKSQTEAFTYRVPSPQGRRTGARVQMIPAGEQVLITGDLDSTQIDAIVAQHIPYGMVRADELDRNRDFVGLCYSIDKPVTTARISRLMETNLDVLEEKGREQREIAAVATNARLENDLRESRVPGELAQMEVEVVEERNDRSNSPETTAQRIRVTRDPHAVGGKPSGRTKQTARRRKA